MPAAAAHADSSAAGHARAAPDRASAGGRRRGRVYRGAWTGLPIAYRVLDAGVPVLAADGEQVGTVHHVVAAPEKDIFHGIVVATPGHGRRFSRGRRRGVDSTKRGVDLRIDSAAASALPEPGGGAPVYAGDPATISTWRHWVHRLTGRSDWKPRG